MGLISTYLFACFLVAVISNITISEVCIQNLRDSEIENVITANPGIFHISTFIMHMIIAPVMILVLVSSSRTDTLRATLTKQLSE